TKPQQTSRRPKQRCWTGARISRKPKHLTTATMGEHNWCVATTSTPMGRERSNRRLVQPRDLGRTTNRGVGGTLSARLWPRRSYLPARQCRTRGYCPFQTRTNTYACKRLPASRTSPRPLGTTGGGRNISDRGVANRDEPGRRGDPDALVPLHSRPGGWRCGMGNDLHHDWFCFGGGHCRSVYSVAGSNLIRDCPIGVCADGLDHLAPDIRKVGAASRNAILMWWALPKKQ